MTDDVSASEVLDRVAQPQPTREWWVAEPEIFEALCRWQER
jgi:hypothetical protein